MDRGPGVDRPVRTSRVDTLRAPDGAVAPLPELHGSFVNSSSWSVPDSRVREEGRPGLDRLHPPTRRRSSSLTSAVVRVGRPERRAQKRYGAQKRYEVPLLHVLTPPRGGLSFADLLLLPARPDRPTASPPRGPVRFSRLFDGHPRHARAPAAVIYPDVYGARRLIRWIAVQQLTAAG